MGTVTATDTRRRDELAWRAARADDAAGVFAAASVRLREIVPFDAAAWMSTDPATGLPTGPTRIEDFEGVTVAQCGEHWRREFVVEDVNRFATLARAPRPAAALRHTAGDPDRSPRYRAFLRPLGFADELRAVLRAGATPWGTVTLWRRDGRPAFTPRDTEIVASLSAPLAEALRAAARPADGTLRASGPGEPHDRPGLLLFDAEGELRSVDDQARAWLSVLPAEPGIGSDLGVVVPMWLVITVFNARASLHRGGRGARVRVRSLRGRWLVCHASCLYGADGTPADTAVVVEPATPAETAPIVVEAYDLSPREQEITRLIARGAGTADIAGELHLSPHTVRDHVKAIFAKVEVSSRGELVAKLFAEHFAPNHAQSVTYHTT